MIKKILLLIALVYISTTTVFAKTSVISTVEDTLQRTRGESFREFYQSLLVHKVFEGMDAFLKNYPGDLYLLSEKYDPLAFNIDGLLDEVDLEPKELVTRSPFLFPSEESYKLSQARRIIDSSSDSFVLIGNDKGVDQKVFQKLRKLYGPRIQGAYLHVVENKKLPKGLIPYNTAFDIAVSEYSQGRMGKKETLNIGSSINKLEKFHKVFPKNSHCPRNKNQLQTKKVKSFAPLIGSISRKTLEYCNS